MASQEGLSMDTQVAEVVVPQWKYSKRVLLKTILGRSDGGVGLVGQRVVVGGWVKSAKEQTNIELPVVAKRGTGPKDVTCVEILQSRIPLFRAMFKALGGNNSPVREKLNAVLAKPVPSTAYIQISDGSCVPCLQVVLESSTAALLNKFTPTGTSILVEGVLKQSSVPGKQVMELKVEKVLHLGTIDLAKYPLSRTKLPLDILRGYSHLRPRTTTVASVTRIRSSLTHGTHTFFQNHGFLHVHMPVITGTDAKGFSEKFQVTTISGKENKKDVPSPAENYARINHEVIKAAIKEKSSRIEELKRSESNKEALAIAVHDLQKANELASKLEAHEKSHQSTTNQDGKVDLTHDFFSCPMFLTVSNQFHLESYASSLGSVYTIGPVFSAEKSVSTKHLAEMWMVELEIAFADLEDLMNCAEDYLRFLAQWVLDNCSADVNFLSRRTDKTIIDHLQYMASNSFEKITYTEAVQLLQKVTDKTFEVKIEWGVALTDEHERYLVDEMYKRPVIIYNHPKELKPFFVRVNDDGNTVATIDVVIPKAGTVIRGSQKEDRMNMISTRIKELGLPREKYEWYLDLRRHGSVKHSGFSLGFDQMVMLATGLSDIRDVVPFPRSCGDANY